MTRALCFSGRGFASAGEGKAVKETGEVAVFPGDENLAGDEDGGVGAGDDAEEESKEKDIDLAGAEEEERDDSEDDGERGVDGAGDGLGEAGIDDFIKGRIAVGGDVFADAVEDDDGVVDGEADDGEEAGDEHAVDFGVEEVAEDGECGE